MSGGRATAAGRVAGVFDDSTSEGAAIAPDALARRILAAPKRSVFAVSGTTSDAIRNGLDRVEDCEQRVLFLKFPSANTTDSIVEKIIAVLAETALRLWPIWFDNVSFGQAANDKAGRQAAAEIVRGSAPALPGLMLPWALKATQLALAGRLPRVRKTNPTTELTQLSLAIGRTGLILLFDCDDIRSDERNQHAAISALEWIAVHGDAAVIALFSELPPFVPPFDRILYGALRVGPTDLPGAPLAGEPAHRDEPWIAPWRGKPHPLSDVELRMFNALGKDPALAPLFTFNTLIDTVHGSKPKVDLLWKQGRLVIELDGYGSHGNRTAFIGDRQRDYELLLSGYIVLRLVNEEVQQDLELALEKIRSVVRIQKRRTVRDP